MAQVGPRGLNYLSDSEVKTARIQIDGFSSLQKVFSSSFKVGSVTVWGTGTPRRELLYADDLAQARTLCARHLVSRDTSTLTASEVAGATIDTVEVRVKRR